MSREIEGALADCLAKLKGGKATLEEALRPYPELRSELEPLLLLALELRSMPKVSAPESLRSLKRPDFSAVPSSARARRPLLPWGWRVLRPTPAWTGPVARLAAGLAVAVMLMGGTVVASASSLPAEPLYPVKLAVENAQLALASNPQNRAELEMQFASRRLQEVETAARQGKIQAVEQGLSLYEVRVQGALSQTQSAGATSASETQQIQDSLTSQQETLTRVLNQVPDVAKPAIEHAMQVSERGSARSGEKPGNGPQKADVISPTATGVPASPTSTTVVPSSATSTAVVPADRPDKGHEPPGQAKASAEPPGQAKDTPTAVPTAQPQQTGIEKPRGNSDQDTGKDRGQGNDKQESGPSASTDAAVAPVPPTSTPLPAAASARGRSFSPNSVPDRLHTDSSRGQNGARSLQQGSTPGQDGSGTDDGKSNNGRDKTPSARGGNRPQ